jgi:hypothetical protein
VGLLFYYINRFKGWVAYFFMGNTFEKPCVLFGAFRNRIGIKYSGNDNNFFIIERESQIINESLDGYWTPEYSKSFRSFAGLLGYVIREGYFTPKELHAKIRKDFPSRLDGLEGFFKAIENIKK